MWGHPPKKTYNSPPPVAAKLCAVNRFFSAGKMNYKIYHGNFLLADNKTSLSNQKCANLCLKFTKIRLAAGLFPDSRGKLMRSRRRPAAMRGPTSKRREGRDLLVTEGRKAVVKVDRRIRWHYTTTILRLRIGARLTSYRNCKFHNFARTISRHADGISRYSVPPSAGPLYPWRKGRGKGDGREKREERGD